MTSVQVYPIESKATGHRTVGLVFFYFVIAGVATVMLGPALPLLAERWNLPDSLLGTLFIANFGGQVCGAWLTTGRLGRWLLFGALATGVSLLALAFVGPGAAHLALFFNGLGLGAGLAAGNVIVGTMHPADTDRALDGRGSSRSRLLALLNACWGIGAIACPLLLVVSVRMCQRSWVHRFAPVANDGRLFFAELALAFLLCAGLIAWLLPRNLYQSSQDAAAGKRLPRRALAIFLATMGLYVGVETALGGWLPTYAHRLSGNLGAASWESGRAPSIALCFWVSELAGRSLMALVVKRLNERWLYWAGTVALIASAGALTFIPHLSTPGIFALTVAAGLSLAPLYPLIISFLLAWTGNHPRVGRMFASSSLGATVIPWLTGVFSSRFALLRLGFIVPTVGAALLLLLSFYLPRGQVRGLAAIAADR